MIEAIRFKAGDANKASAYTHRADVHSHNSVDLSDTEETETPEMRKPRGSNEEESKLFSAVLPDRPSRLGRALEKWSAPLHLSGGPPLTAFDYPAVHCSMLK
jgi:hypothetical protein